MQPLAARLGVGSVLPIIDANWFSEQDLLEDEKLAYILSK